MTADPCPACKGRCCRDYYLYRVVHMGAEHYQHDCDACEDGTKYVPKRTAEDERADVVAWLREHADAEHPIERGVPSLSPAGRGLLLLHADCFAEGKHVGAAKRVKP